MSWKTRLDQSPIAKRLATGAFWSLIASVASRSFALLASIVMARWLGKVAFGEYGIILSTLDMFGTMAGFGMGLTPKRPVESLRFQVRQHGFSGLSGVWYLSFLAPGSQTAC